ncbi:LysR substrate-binding domain-containing protein [Lysobacter sp. D1-1-M9]|uniref:LysR substrate-binding domain-containing protein n=1 Tax=Novilysobacter longmucuonensis TaxID=3098603 RepID=UPI002FC5C006
MSRLPLHALLGFAAAARSGNLTRAAGSMHLTVSALSHQIRTLEERLDRQLFDRSPRGVRLTGEGERLLAKVAPHLDALELALRPYGPRRDDVLTLSVTPSMASAWLVPRLGDFLAAHPQLEINLQSSTAVVNFEHAHGVDAALRIGRGNWPGVESEHLFDEWVAPIASPALIARMGGMPGPDDLHRWPLLGDPDPHNLWELWFARHGGQPPQRYVAYFDDSEALHRGAAAGVGVALGKLTRVRLLIESGQLVVLTDARLQTDYAHYLVYPPRSADHAGLQALRTWLHGQARDYAAGEPGAKRRRRAGAS